MRMHLSTAGLARLSARRPWRTLGLWVFILVLAAIAASGVNGVLTTDDTIYGSEAAAGDALIQQRLRGEAPMSETVIVHSDSTTVDDAAFQQVVQATTADLRDMPAIVATADDYYQARDMAPDAAARMVSPDRHSALIAVTFVRSGHDASMDADAYLATLKRHEGEGYHVAARDAGCLIEAFG